MSNLAIHFSHDSTIGFSPYPGVYRCYELERLTKKRYFTIDMYSLFTGDKPYSKALTEDIIKTVRDQVVDEFGEEALNLEKVYVDQRYPEVDLEAFNNFGLRPHEHIWNCITRYFKVPAHYIWEHQDHHTLHALSSFYQSPFQEAFVISFDGGGLASDSNFANYFCGYHLSRDGYERRVFSFPLHLCSLYNAFPYLTETIKGNINSVPGKAMGLAGYSDYDCRLYKRLKPIFHSEDWVTTKVNRDGTGEIDNEYIYDIIQTHFELKERKEKLGFYQGAELLATVQTLFEDVFIEYIKPHAYKYNLPLVLTGGGALNVLNNTRVKNELGLPVYVACNPNDTGTVAGSLFMIDRPKEQIDLRFANFDLFDRKDLSRYVEERNATKYTTEQVAGLLRDGKIIGVVKGRAECGPRALGNRSIICDPSIDGMKDTLNAKVKHREHFRPFAPMVLQEEASEYFNWDNTPAPHMSFSAIVRDQYAQQLKEITHVDRTARIQTISEEDNKWYYDLLIEMKKTGLPVVLNTSFNILGKPILNTIEDALYVLDNTELDYVIVEEYIFSK